MNASALLSFSEKLVAAGELIQSDCSESRKLISKAKPQKMTGTDLNDIRQAMQRLETSSANAFALAEQEVDSN